MCYFIQCCISSQHKKSIASSVVPKNLSALDILKFGKITKPAEKKILNVGVEEFNIESKERAVLGPVLFLTEISPFGEGDFHYSFRTSSNHHKFRDATYVIKRFKKSALEKVEILNQSPEIQSREVVQMNSLARNLNAQFSDRCATIIKDFSKTV